MKAVITEDGILRIWPEQSIESYALAQWSKENFNSEHGTFRGEAILIVTVLNIRENKT